MRTVVSDVSDSFGTTPPPGSWIVSCLALVLCSFLLLGCCATTIPKVQDRTVSTALADPGETELGSFFQLEIETHPGKSGIVLVPTGEWGFRTHVGRSKQAKKSIDVQYYIEEQDRLFMAENDTAMALL